MYVAHIPFLVSRATIPKTSSNSEAWDMGPWSWEQDQRWMALPGLERRNKLPGPIASQQAWGREQIFFFFRFPKKWEALRKSAGESHESTVVQATHHGRLYTWWFEMGCLKQQMGGLTKVLISRYDAFTYLCCTSTGTYIYIYIYIHTYVRNTQIKPVETGHNHRTKNHNLAGHQVIGRR